MTTNTNAGAMARRLAGCVNALHNDPAKRANGYRADAVRLRGYAERMPSLPAAQEIYRNAADLLDDWALQLYKEATV